MGAASPQPPLVLIHGAFQTAATWDLVAPRLEAAGRRVIVAALTGLERDPGELHETVALDTHIRDIVALLTRENLFDVTLVGHSYAGMIITGVAEHARDRIAHLVYVDALVPEHGQSARDILPEPTRNTFRKLAEEGGGWRMQPNEHLLDLWGLERVRLARLSRSGWRISPFAVSRSLSRRPRTRLTSFLVRTSRA